MGYLILIPVARAIHKQQVFTDLTKHSGKRVERITIEKGSVQIILKYGKKEILYKGCMYDILSSVDHGTSVTYTCIRDMKEEKLNRLSQQATGDPPPARTVRNLIDGIIKIGMITEKPPLNVFVNNIRWFCHPIIKYSEPSIAAPGHPPRET